MNIIVFSAHDNLGAGKAAYRIQKSFNKSGHNCKLVVKNKSSIDKNVVTIRKSSFRRIYLQFFHLIKSRFKKLETNPNYYFFGFEYNNYRPKEIIASVGFKPDLIIICWISTFISPTSIRKLAVKSKAKVIAYPVDMSLFTGGCHYSWSCNGYTKFCFNCPAIITPKYKNLAAKLLKEKINQYNKMKIKLITCTHQLKIEAKLSTLFNKQDEIENVLLPIDRNIFNNHNREYAKLIFNIEKSSFSILFGASVSYEERKGVLLFIESLEKLYNELPDLLKGKVRVIIVGNKNDDNLLKKIPFKVVLIDYINDDLLLSVLYQASDVFVSASIQDSGPMMINEALMCGTPVVAFNIGVAEDLIYNSINGFKVDVGSTDQLAESLLLLVSKSKEMDYQKISDLANEKTGETFFSERFLHKV